MKKIMLTLVMRPRIASGVIICRTISPRPSRRDRQPVAASAMNVSA